MRTLVWFRGKDLRVADHPALASACASGEVVPLFVVDPYFFAPERAKEIAHRMQYLVESLAVLSDSIRRLGSTLVLAAGKSVDVVPRLAREWKVDRVVAMRWVEPFARARDERVRAALGVPFELFEGETLSVPGSLRTAGGKPFVVFSQFARAFAACVRPEAPLPPPARLPPLPAGVKASACDMPTLASLGIERNPNLVTAGEAEARARLARYLERHARDYDRVRDRLDLAQTSRLSADLKFGTLSARTVWHAAHVALASSAPKALSTFANELVWREFTHSLLWDRPEVLDRPFRREFEGFAWSTDEAAWRAWAEGRTGYPVVDAAARQLLGEGFVHNRARMISASFLTKDLLVDYRMGERHYMKHLVDGDWAQNNCGWQWSAGCGCDAQPYFRVFSPKLQAEKFDPTGDYVRRWVPELSRMPAEWIHDPSAAPAHVLDAAGVRLDKTYPLPIVDHAEARKAFLARVKAHVSRTK